ncbi:sensor domain-containing diguanylate cyclase [Acinetobacter bereziniae]|nr:sensor domain-containing diguanylate cyclase [Acinetobacter bereziniae]MBJ8553203.1 GGDEF domain-containing protein [Acinetobacter bereziniae]MCU4314374.1 sensor domain-containing diguanylate cyclase [Acinetobacter bereziniae]MDA3440351.1 sensor domain-containing diguanylate cyclase [Acinetobacter bereziniae]
MKLKKFIFCLKLNLRKLILFLAVFSIVILFIASLFVNYSIQKKELLDTSLSVNMEYATKIAQKTDSQIQTVLKQLDYSAMLLGQSFDDEKFKQSEVDRLKFQSNFFDSVIISDKHGRILNFSPSKIALNKNVINRTLGFTESLDTQKTVITSPYYSVKKNLIVFISQPIFDRHKNYLGFVGGAIYLKERNIINELLTISFNYKDSYMYVLDSQHKIIFHPDVHRIGTYATDNTGLDYMEKHSIGKIRLINSKGVDNLAGFAKVKHTDWIIVSQQPTHKLLEKVPNLIYKIIAYMLVFYILIFLIIWKISYYISAPLNRLATMASHLNNPETANQIKDVDALYYEVRNFKRSLLQSSSNFSKRISTLNHYVNTDPLTGLYNRRGMELHIERLMKSNIPFAIIAVDIDYFKKINDQYGHEKGDMVLKRTAQHIKDCVRNIDICCRIGGEEFVILSPIDSQNLSINIAERIRQLLEKSPIDHIPAVTVSIGIAHWPEISTDIHKVFKAADEYLYLAKAEGRNCIRYKK